MRDNCAIHERAINKRAIHDYMERLHPMMKYGNFIEVCNNCYYLDVCRRDKNVVPDHALSRFLKQQKKQKLAIGFLYMLVLILSIIVTFLLIMSWNHNIPSPDGYITQGRKINIMLQQCS